MRLINWSLFGITRHMGNRWRKRRHALFWTSICREFAYMVDKQTQYVDLNEIEPFILCLETVYDLNRNDL